MALTINNQPTDETYTLTTRGGQKYNIRSSALGAKKLKITAPDGTVIENPSPELLQQINEYIQQINYNKPYIDAQGQANYSEYDQGEVKPAEDVSTPVNAVNQYFRRLNYDLANNKVPSGWYTLPAIGLAATGIGAAMSAPVTAAATMAGGWLGSKAVDGGMNLATGKSWAENMSDWTGLDATPAEMTNPGMWVGGTAPFVIRGSRTLLSAGDQIVKDAMKDIVHYGPVSIMRNPEGWYRPYVDQVRNGWQGWKDSKITLPDQSKEVFKGFQSGEPIEEIERYYWQGHPLSEYTTSNPQYHDILSRDGTNFYYRANSESLPLWGVTQNSNEPNTYMFHIGGNKYFRLGRADKLNINKAAESLPKGSYVSDLPEENLISGQIGINFARQNGRTPTLGEMIKASKMKSEIIEPNRMRGYDDVHETPLSSSSMTELLSRGTNPRRPWELRYANGYMTHFNTQGLHPQLHPNNFLFLPKQERLQLTTDFVNKFPGARTPFIGLDGKLKISIPLNRKTN